MSTTWISLGGGCHVAHHLRRRGLAQRAMPFDWIRTPMPGLIALLERDFEGFLAHDELQVSERILRDGAYDVRLMHHRHLVDHSGSELLREHFAARISAFREALRTHHVMFVRASMPCDRAAAFHRRLSACLPATRFTLVTVDESNGAAHSVQRRGAALAATLPSGSSWKGDANAWDWLFAQVGVLVEAPSQTAE